MIIDGSGSVGKRNFKKNMKFFKNLVKQFPLGTNANRFAAIQYSKTAKVEFGFDDNLTDKKLDKAIGKINWMKGITRTDKALKLARETLEKTVSWCHFLCSF